MKETRICLYHGRLECNINDVFFRPDAFFVQGLFSVAYKELQYITSFLTLIQALNYIMVNYCQTFNVY